MIHFVFLIENQCGQDQGADDRWIAGYCPLRGCPDRASAGVQVSWVTGSGEESGVNIVDPQQNRTGGYCVCLPQMVLVEKGQHLPCNQNSSFPHADPANSSLWIRNLDPANLGFEQTRGISNAMSATDPGNFTPQSYHQRKHSGNLSTSTNRQ